VSYAYDTGYTFGAIAILMRLPWGDLQVFLKKVPPRDSAFAVAQHTVEVL
jgi:hypothetical protein